jgi:hypothetical protein
VIEQVAQIGGALLVLAGFALAQFGTLEQTSYAYLVPNATGSSAMAVTALLNADWGFLFLEGVWALVSLWGIAARARGAIPQAGH